MTVVVFATFKGDTAIYVADGTTTMGFNQTLPVFLMDLQSIPPGVYSVTFAAVTISNAAVSYPNTPITIIVPP